MNKGPRTLMARPTCAVCERRVESFTEEDCTGVLTGRIEFVARCHGAVERVVVWKYQTPGLNFGLAFVSASALKGARIAGALSPIPEGTCPSP